MLANLNEPASLTSASLLGAPGLTSNKKLLVTSSSLLVTKGITTRSILAIVTMFATRSKRHRY